MSSAHLLEVAGVYRASNGDATRALYARLEELGPAGRIAVDLFRAQKSSERAKAYRGGDGKGSYRGKAYDRKAWAIDNLSRALGRDAAALGIAWGWGVDEKQPVHRHVLYIELPTGQVSYHSAGRGAGPDHAQAWDGVRGQSADRVIRHCARLLDAAAAAPAEAAQDA